MIFVHEKVGAYPFFPDTPFGRIGEGDVEVEAVRLYHQVQRGVFVE